MTSLEHLHALEEVQTDLRHMVEVADTETYRRQYHPDLSCLGWHLGHCVFTECYWLREVLLGDDRYTNPVAKLYTPPHVPKPLRGNALPPQAELLEWARRLQTGNRELLAGNNGSLPQHYLLDDDYVVRFLTQHYSQHCETAQMVLTQKMLARMHRDQKVPGFAAGGLIPRRDTRHVPAGEYSVGGIRPGSYDNELPRHRENLESFEIAARPVSNGEYLAFMEDGGYARKGHWDPQGWDWRQATGSRCPDHWLGDRDHGWQVADGAGLHPLDPDKPLMGVNYHEASAYARWVGGTLPHEHQWEVAAELNLLSGMGQAWEWCRNSFFPYDGFTAFPYNEYSAPWFDGNHFTLKGSSPHTRPWLRRNSFRNFYEPDKRHIFAGVRPVFD